MFQQDLEAPWDSNFKVHSFWAPWYFSCSTILYFYTLVNKWYMNSLKWFAGAIFGALEVLADRSVSKERYAQDKKIPDWASCEVQAMDNIPILDAPLERPVLSRRQTSGITSTLSSISSSLSSRLLSGGSRSPLASGLLQRMGGSPSSGTNPSIKENDKNGEKEGKKWS